MDHLGANVPLQPLHKFIEFLPLAALLALSIDTVRAPRCFGRTLGLRRLPSAAARADPAGGRGTGACGGTPPGAVAG